jgi:tRNA nucleotidyltransferase (CCA-adding enzyme)
MPLYGEQPTAEPARSPVSPERWEHFPHKADIGVRGHGKAKAAAFVQAALAMTAVITDPHLVQSREKLAVSCSAADDELLLLDWLNGILFEMATRKMLFGRFEVLIEAGELRATIWGEPVDVGRHEPAVEIKGATFTELRVCRSEEGGWLAQCVVDV